MLKLILYYYIAKELVLYNFTDLHCHALFNVDDGARNKEMSYKMLDLAYSDGIKTICFTPHFKIHHFASNEEIESYNTAVQRSFSALQSYAQSKYPDLNLLLGNEIMFHNDICDSLSAEKCRSIGETKYLLIEFRPETPYFEIKNAISKIARRGFFPIIAHVERYGALVKDFKLIDELKELGAILQVNAQSISNFKIGRTANFIRKIFKKSLVDVVCTDAHDDKLIYPNLSDSYKLVCKMIGKDRADLIYFENPTKIVNNERII